jgi:hypothetical protein
MPASDKDTIYIDIDDEITGIIDKLQGSSGKVVALVLPKRATVFQSIVNMKLLKRAADAQKKNAVLITSEAGLLPLAGMAGVHVAKTLNSKPEIPLAPNAMDNAVASFGEDGQELAMPPDPKQTVGELADKEAAPKPPTDGVETLMLDADDIPPEDLKKAGADGKSFEPPAGAKKPKNKKLKVPNFERFRLLLILGAVLIVLLILGFIFANATLPKATISIKTNATNVDANFNLALSTGATTLDPNGNTIPAKLSQQQKTYTASAVTTGQKNNGNKAQGTINISGGDCGANPNLPADLPSGSGFSSNGLTYLTQEAVTFVFAPSGGGKKCTVQGVGSNNKSDIPIVAQANGLSSNTSGTPFSDPNRTDLSASGSASGGTDSIVQTVNQNDINSAKAKITVNSNSVQQYLQNQLQQGGYYAIGSTYQAGTPNVTTSANVGDAANTVTVTETVTYTMFGVHQSDLNTLIDNNVNGQINTAKQSILSTGLDKAVFSVNSSTSTGAQIAFTTVAVAGPQLNVASIKQQAEGQKTGALQTQLQNNPNVTGVTVKLSPFWISTVPKNASRITVNIAKPTTTAKAGSSASTP